MLDINMALKEQTPSLKFHTIDLINILILHHRRILRDLNSIKDGSMFELVAYLAVRNLNRGCSGFQLIETLLSDQK